MRHFNLKEQSADRLRRNFITADYRGKEYQEASFREFMRREWWKFWKWI